MGTRVRNRIIYILLLLCLCFPKEAFVSQVFFKEISLKKMVKKADFIVAAEYIKKNKDTNPYDIFKIAKILKKNSQLSNPGDKIIVRAAGYCDGLMVYRRYKETGIMTSRYIDYFEPEGKIKLTKGKKYLIFLKTSCPPKEYELVAWNGFLNIEMEDKIKKIINN